MSELTAIDPDSGEVLVDRGSLPLPGRVTRTSLDLPVDLSFEGWRSAGEWLANVERSVSWWVGDWWAFGEHRYGERAKMVRDALWRGPSFQVCMTAGHVAGRFEALRRRKDLSFSHHREVASLPPAEADALLDAAEANGWSKRELRAEVHCRKTAARIEAPANSDACTVEDLNVLADSGAKFGTIYADPPWRYSNVATRASVDDHYAGTMSIAELCELPVGRLAAKNAHLHLWTTNGFLFECPALFAAWGFEFKSAFVWVKPQMGIGNYWRNSHEYLLTAVRGDAKSFADHSLKSWAEIDRGEHSAKPEQLRTMIERASPPPYLELFGRRVADRWTVWGNQIDRCLFGAAARKIA